MAEDGLATAVKAGSATVTGKYKGNNYYFKLTVKNATLKYTKKTSTTGASYELTLKDANGKTINDGYIKWTCSDSGVATIDSNGVVTTKSAGTATIGCRYMGKLYKCKITVKDATPKYTKKSIYAGTSFKQVLKNCFGDNISSKDIKWYTSDSSVATVSSSGTVKGVGEGKATITAKYLNKSYKCTVTVKKSIMTVGSTKVSLMPGDTKKIKCSLYDVGEIRYEVENTFIATCRWADSFDGYDTYLYIDAENPGTTKVHITNTINSQKVTIEIKVGSDVKVKLQKTPKTVKSYDPSGKLLASLYISDMDYQLQYNENTGLYNLWVGFVGKRGSEGGKSGVARNCYLHVKVYNSDGKVVNSEIIYIPDLDKGEQFSDIGYMFYGLEKGTYTVKLFNAKNVK